MQDDETTGVSAHEGFPNAGLDNSLSALDIQKILLPRPLSTFFMRLRGNAWEKQGIFDGDIVVIDRALAPKTNDTVIWWGSGGFHISRFGSKAKPMTIWGVVTN